MVDFVLVIAMAVVPVILSVMNALFIIHFQHPEDTKEAVPAKIMCALGLLIAEITVLFLPLDVVNTSAEGGLPMSDLWMVLYVLVALFSIIIMPFSYLWYVDKDGEIEGLEEKTNGARFVSTFLETLLVIFFFALVVALLFVFFGIAEVDVQRIDAELVIGEDSKSLVANRGCTGECRSAPGAVDVRVSPVLFIITVIDFFGYLLTVCLGSVGLTYIPYSLIVGFAFRPSYMTDAEYKKYKAILYDRTTNLLDSGKQLRNQRRMGNTSQYSRRQLRKKLNDWNTEVDQLEADVKKLEGVHQELGKYILLSWVKLFVGIIAMAISICWFLQVLLYLVIPGEEFPFLNSMFITLNNAWSFLGTIAYGLFAVYLLVCVLVGLIRFGLTLFFFHVHPLVKDDTPITSLTFNTVVILICSMTVTHFCTQAFRAYAYSTDAARVFNMSLGNLRVLKYFFRYSVFGFVLIPLVTLILLFACKVGMKIEEFSFGSSEKKSA